MDIESIFLGYEKRINIIGSYFLLSSVTNNRNKFREFENVEFYNMLIETLCYIFEKSLKREYCFKDDIREFLEEINSIEYNKVLSAEDIDELTVYILNSLTNNGKVFYYSYYSVNSNSNVHSNIKIITTDNVMYEGKDRLSYSLTTEGYRLILATKEYDELFQIKVSQMLSRLRLQKDDMVGARHDVLNIVNNLEIQMQRIESFIKMIRADINTIKSAAYVDVVDETFKILIEEMDKYDELKGDAELKLRDREEYLEGENELLAEKVKNIQTQLTQIKELIDSISTAKIAASRLLTRIQDFRREYKSVLEQLLKVPVLKKFSFTTEIQEKIEEDVNLLNSLAKIYRPLFRCSPVNIFGVNVPYGEQSILGNNLSDEELAISKDEFEVELDYEKENNIIRCENIHYVFVRKLFEYAMKKQNFTLKDFFKYYAKEHKDDYIKLTEDSEVLRNVIMYFAFNKDVILIPKVLKLVDELNFTPSTDFQIERMVGRLESEDIGLIKSFYAIESQMIVGDSIKINTELDIESLSAIPLEINNVEFTFRVEEGI